MHRTSQLAIVAMATALVAPAFAADQGPHVSGYGFFGEVELGGTAFWIGGDAVNDNVVESYQGLNAAARLGARLDNGIHLQGDATGEYTTVDGGTPAPDDENESYKSSATLTGHLAYAYGGGIVGGFAGALWTDQDNDATDTSRRYFAGAQGRHLVMPDIAVFGQAGYLWGTGGDDDDGLDSIRDAWFGRAGASYYLDDSTRLSGAVLYMDGEMDDDGGDPARVWSIDLDAERQFTANGLSGFARYSYTNLYQGGGEDETITENTVSVGLKWRFGAGASSLKDADFNGAITNMPNFARIAAQTGGPLE